MKKTENENAKKLREQIEESFVSGKSLEVVYFGGSLPGTTRLISPRYYSPERGDGYVIAFCHRSEMEKTYKIERMHLLETPLADGQNDYLIIRSYLNRPIMLDTMLRQIAELEESPIEGALSKYLAGGGELAQFFDEYSYGGYILELTIGANHLALLFGYEAADQYSEYYYFSLKTSPKLMPRARD